MDYTHVHVHPLPLLPHGRQARMSEGTYWSAVRVPTPARADDKPAATSVGVLRMDRSTTLRQSHTRQARTRVCMLSTPTIAHMTVGDCAVTHTHTHAHTCTHMRMRAQGRVCSNYRRCHLRRGLEGAECYPGVASKGHNWHSAPSSSTPPDQADPTTLSRRAGTQLRSRCGSYARRRTRAACHR